jgi:putative toxin-antitoxin system antitoxin component (TIGR02293 family)
VVAAQLSPPPAAGADSCSSLPVDPAILDAVVLALLADTSLQQEVRGLPKTELSRVLDLTRQALADQVSGAEPIGSMEVHRRLLEGLAGESLLVSASLFLRSLAEAEEFFGLSFKTIKARMGGVLDAATSERALRATRAALTAARVLGSHEAARAYLHTPNFALGGAMPAELIRTAEGERIVLNELQAHADCGPL